MISWFGWSSLFFDAEAPQRLEGQSPQVPPLDGDCPPAVQPIARRRRSRLDGSRAAARR